MAVVGAVKMYISMEETMVSAEQVHDIPPHISIENEKNERESAEVALHAARGVNRPVTVSFDGRHPFVVEPDDDVASIIRKSRTAWTQGADRRRSTDRRHSIHEESPGRRSSDHFLSTPLRTGSSSEPSS